MDYFPPNDPKRSGRPPASLQRDRRRKRLFRLTVTGLVALSLVLIGARVLFGGGPDDPALSQETPVSVHTVGGSAPVSVAPSTVASPTQRPSPVDRTVYSTKDGTLSRELQKLVDWGLPVYCGGGEQPLVALTFDDGPGVLTQETIDNLQTTGTPATFFLVGKLLPSETNQKIALAEAKWADMGNHSWSHYGLAGVSEATLDEEIDRPQRYLKKLLGETPVFFRPPWGSRDDALVRHVQTLGMIEVIWSLDSLDSTTGTNGADILKTLDKGLSAGDIVLMHENRGTTSSVLPQVIEMVREKGLQPVTLSELLTLDPPTRQQVKSGSCG